MPFDSSSTDVAYWQGFPGPGGYLDIPTFTLFPLGRGVLPIGLRDDIGFAYLIRVVFPLMVGDGTETIYIAASFSRTTQSNDIPPNTYIPGVLDESSINFQFRLFSGIEPSPSGTSGFGAIVLLDTIGELDYLIDKPWDGAKLDILRGSPYDYFSSYNVVAKLTTAGILYDQRRKEIRLRDQGWILQQAGLHDQIYAGTGGKEGTEDLKGVYKPYGIGPCFNCEPIIVDPNNEIRQLTFTSMLAVDVVKDGGVPLAYSGFDYDSFDDLKAAAENGDVPASEYSTCLAEGFIALGSKPVFTVTVDFRADNNVINGTGYEDTLGGACRRIVTGYGKTKLTDLDIDFISLNILGQLQPFESGWWWKDHVTKGDAIQRVLAGRLGVWGVRINGLVAFSTMREPIDAPFMIVNYPEDFTAEPSQKETYQVPRRSTFLSHTINNTVMDSGQLAGTVIDSGDALVLGQPNGWSDESVADFSEKAFPTAPRVHVSDSGIYNHVDANIEAIRQMDLMGIRRELWTIQVPFSPYTDVVGKVVQVNNFPRYNWGASRKFYCVGLSFGSGISVTLYLWG